MFKIRKWGLVKNKECIDELFSSFLTIVKLSVETRNHLKKRGDSEKPYE